MEIKKKNTKKIHRQATLTIFTAVIAAWMEHINTRRFQWRVARLGWATLTVNGQKTFHSDW